MLVQLQLFVDVCRQARPEQQGLSAGLVRPHRVPDGEQWEAAPARSAVRLSITGVVHVRTAAFRMNRLLSIACLLDSPTMDSVIAPPPISPFFPVKANTGIIPGAPLTLEIS